MKTRISYVSRALHQLDVHTSVVFGFIGSSLVFSSIGMILREGKDSNADLIGQLASVALVVTLVSLIRYCLRDCRCESTVDIHRKLILQFAGLTMVCMLLLSGFALMFHRDYRSLILITQALFGVVMASSPFLLKKV